jgi:antitoxin (DNA-binding transcriptional repressor) of toxin-antitoxin stability system
MHSITLQEAQSHLGEIIDNLPPGTEVVITRDDKPVAAIRALTPTPRISEEEIEQHLRQGGDRPLAEILPASEPPHPVPGRCQGMLTILSEDDEHLKDWAEYMP